MLCPGKWSSVAVAHAPCHYINASPQVHYLQARGGACRLATCVVAISCSRRCCCSVWCCCYHGHWLGSCVVCSACLAGTFHGRHHGNTRIRRLRSHILQYVSTRACLVLVARSNYQPLCVWMCGCACSLHTQPRQHPPAHQPCQPRLHRRSSNSRRRRRSPSQATPTLSPSELGTSYTHTHTHKCAT